MRAKFRKSFRIGAENTMTEPNVVRSLITPRDQTLRIVFNNPKSYYIDIYQREYKWTGKNVNTLLNDIEVQFQQKDRPKTKPEDIKVDVLARFEPYFLNTFLTHRTAANSAIVDGQQRLTTFLLIFIKLYRLLQKVEEDPENRGKTFASGVLGQLVFETSDFGKPDRFKIFNENREEAFQALIEGREVQTKDETRKRIKENFDIISEYLDRFLSNSQNGTYDLVKTTYYIAYLLDRISIVEIHIERGDNIAMIFEVVNDRGQGLKPYEILKGKLIGNLPVAQKEIANRVWTEMQDQYFAVELKNTTEKTIDLDSFFRTFFRAKFADSEKEYESFEGDYHYEMYRNPKIQKFFGRFEDRGLLFRRITEDFRYFADLYFRLRTNYAEEYLVFNKLLDQSQQYMLLLSNILLNDQSETSKITSIARKFDQIHVILRLLEAYDSNQFQRYVYPLNVAIRDKDATAALPEFDKMLIDALEEDGRITAGTYKKATDLFDYERFKGIENKWVNFSKYILMRIDRYLADALGKPSFASSDLEELEAQFNRFGNRRYGMHLEHIYTQHEGNKALFTTEGVFDESAFQQTRNLLGMVLLLKDKHNLSSSDEIYRDKCKTYSMSNLIWNELLVGHLQDIDARSLPAELQFHKIEPTANGVFPREKVNERQKAVFEAIKLIWGSF